MALKLSALVSADGALLDCVYGLPHDQVEASAAGVAGMVKQKMGGAAIRQSSPQRPAEDKGIELQECAALQSNATRLMLAERDSGAVMTCRPLSESGNPVANPTRRLGSRWTKENPQDPNVRPSQFQPGWMEGKLVSSSRYSRGRPQQTLGWDANDRDQANLDRVWHRYGKDLNDARSNNVSDCGDIQEAKRVASAGAAGNCNVNLMLAKQDVVSWTARMSEYAESGRYRQTLTVYEEMREAGVILSSYTFVAALKACRNLRDLASCRQVHFHVVENGLESNIFVGTMLVDVYAKCGSLKDAKTVFDKMPHRTVVSWNAMILGYSQVQESEVALQYYAQMRDSDVMPDNHIFVAVLKACATSRNLCAGREVHADVLRIAGTPNVYVGNCLVTMYSKCGSLEDARRVFDGLHTRDVVTWNAMISGYVQHGFSHEALALYGSMHQEGITPPNAVTFVSLLQACSSVRALRQGKRLHAQIQLRGFEAVTVVGTCLVDMYAKCGSLDDARRVFDKLSSKNVVTWTSMIAGYVQYGHGEEALALYEFMQRDGVSSPNVVTFICLLQACASAGNLNQGKQLHTKIQDLGLEADVIVGTCLVDMYSKCSCIEAACNVFSNLPTKDVSTWNAMITGYAQHGLCQEALTVYKTMKMEGMAPDAVTFVCLLHACAVGGTLHEGKQLHAQIQERGLEANLVVGNCLLHMYAKCGSMDDVCKVFDNLPNTNVVTWNTMISGYVQHGLGHRALDLYSSMHFDADHVTFVCLLHACVDVGALDMGKLLHTRIQDEGLETDVTVATCLVDLYAKCGSLEDARGVFDAVAVKNLAIWNAMIGGYLQHGLGKEALALYGSMQLCSTISADRVTFLCLLQACARIGALGYVQQLHREINYAGLEADVVVSSTLVDTYAKCGSLQDARKVFDRLPRRNVVTWNAMIAAYSQQGFGQEALALYASMELDSKIRADRVTFVSLLQACASVGALQSGKYLHANIQASGLEADVVIGSSLVDMYAKCGSLKEARNVFEGLPTRNVVTWNSLLNGYALHSHGQSAMQCFEEMGKHGVKPDGTTFICLLAACSHAGLVQEGQWCFRLMIEDHGILPTTNHFNCMVDLLGRSGCLDEAEAVVETLPLQTNFVGWTSLLSACKIHRDVERGKRCFDHLIMLEPQNAAAYVTMASIYASVGRWRDVNGIERLRKSAGAWKKPAKACIEANGKVHEFTVGEERLDVSSKLRSANLSLKEGGYVPQTELVLNAALEKQKEDALCGHAEKLALAYGLLNTSDGTTLLVTKNLRMCNDCHSSTKILSGLEGREIVVRDAHRVHRFLDGSCSCGDRP